MQFSLRTLFTATTAAALLTWYAVMFPGAAILSFIAFAAGSLYVGFMLVLEWVLLACYRLANRRRKRGHPAN